MVIDVDTRAEDAYEARERLASELTETANTYLSTRTTGLVLEQRLQIYFGAESRRKAGTACSIR